MPSRRLRHKFDHFVKTMHGISQIQTHSLWTLVALAPQLGYSLPARLAMLLIALSSILGFTTLVVPAPLRRKGPERQYRSGVGERLSGLCPYADSNCLPFSLWWHFVCSYGEDGLRCLLRQLSCGRIVVFLCGFGVSK